MKLMTKVNKAFDRVLIALVVLAAVFLTISCLSVILEVVMRYFLNRPQVWVIEISEYLLLWVTFLVAAWLLKEEGHVKMDFVLNRLSPRTQSLLNGITSCLCVIVWLALTWYSGQVVWRFLQLDIVTATLKLPRAPIYAIVPVGSFLLFIQFFRRSYGFLRGWRDMTKKEQIRRGNS